MTIQENNWSQENKFLGWESLKLVLKRLRFVGYRDSKGQAWFFKAHSDQKWITTFYVSCITPQKTFLYVYISIFNSNFNIGKSLCQKIVKIKTILDCYFVKSLEILTPKKLYQNTEVYSESVKHLRWSFFRK